MDGLSLVLFVVFGVCVLVALAFTDFLFGDDDDDHEEWKHR